MIRRPTISTLTYTLYPYTTLFRSRQRLRGKFMFGKAGPGGCDHQPVKLRSGKGAARRTLERHLQRFAAASIGREAAKAPTIPECNPQITRSVDGHPVWRALPFAKAGKNPAVRGFARLVQFKLIDKLRGGVGMILGAAIGAERRATRSEDNTSDIHS